MRRRHNVEGCKTECDASCAGIGICAMESRAYCEW